MDQKRICLVSSYPLALLRGGLDIQAVRTYEELSLAPSNHRFEFFDWGSSELADLYHFFGAPPHLWEIIESVRQAGRPYIIHLLSGSRQNVLNPWIRDRVKRSLGLMTNSKILGNASMVAMITENERDLLSRTFSIAREKTVVLPNFVDAAFYDATPEKWREVYGNNPFLLCVGMIQQRKNQLLLAKAANAEALPLVLIGAPMVGENAYAQDVEASMHENAKHGGLWIRGLKQTDPLLISAHKACRAFVLLSRAETQPLSILQAMAAGRPLLLGKSYYTKSEPFRSLPNQVDLASFESIRRGLRAAWEQEQGSSLSDVHRTGNVIAALNQLYDRVLNCG